MRTVRMQPSVRLLSGAAASAVACLSLVACGGVEPAGDAAPDDPSASVSETPTESSSASPTESPSESSTQGPSAGQTVEVTLDGDSVTPNAEQVDLSVGDTLRVEITSDRDGELHVHSSPEQEIAFSAGTTTAEVTLDKPGSVDVEEHESGVLVLRILVG